MKSATDSLQISRTAPIWEELRLPAITFASYFLGAQAAFLIGTLSDAIFAPLWPPNIILFYLFLRTPYGDWWKILLAAFPAHVAAELQIGMDWPQLMVAFITNCAVALFNAWALRWLLLRPPWLSTFRHALIFIIVAAGIGPAFVALLGAYVRIYGGGPDTDYWTYWAQWYLANALGNLTLAPVLLAFSIKSGESRSPSLRTLPWPEIAIASAALCFSCIMAIKVSLLWGGISLLPTLLYLPMPLIFWVTVRFGVRGASLAVLTLTITTIWMSLSGPTVFAASTPEENVLALQLFLAGLAVPVLLLGAYVDGVNRAAHRSRALSQMVLRSTEENHRKIAGDLHEGVCQDLAAVCLRARHLFKDLPPQARVEAAIVEEDILHVIRTLRTAAYGMYPPLLAEGGLEPALRSFIGAYSERTGIAVSLHLPAGIGRLAPSSESVAFRIVQEALTNVERHSRSATAQVTLSSQTNSTDILLLRIEDPAPSSRVKRNSFSWLRNLAPSSVAGGLGIAAMTERINAIGGRLHVRSTGGSTVVEAAFHGVALERHDPAAAMAQQACSALHT